MIWWWVVFLYMTSRFVKTVTLDISFLGSNRDIAWWKPDIQTPFALLASWTGISNDNDDLATNAAFLSVGPFRTNFCEIWIEIHFFSFMKWIWNFRVRNGGHFAPGKISWTWVSTRPMQMNIVPKRFLGIRGYTKWKGRHIDGIFVIGCTGSYRNDNDISVSMLAFK